MLNVRDGETIVLGGLLQEQDRRTKVTIPWIGDIPILGNLLSSFKTNRTTTEVILTITPHVIQPMRPPGLQTQAFWSGTESVYATSPLFLNPAKKTSAVMGPSSGIGAPVAAWHSMKKRLEAGDTMTEAAVSLMSQLSLQPADVAISVGKEFKIDVMARRPRGIAGETLKLAFDSRIVEFREAAEGELLGGMRSKAAITSHSTDGAVELRFHKPATMTRNEGRLLSLTFVAKAPGVSPVRVTMADETVQEQFDLSRFGRGVVRVR